MKCLFSTFISIRLKSQVEELGKTLDMIEELKKRKAKNEDFVSHFRLADHVFVKARAKPVETVGLWLGVSRKIFFL